MHGGDEITLVCVKYMTEALAEEFVTNTNEIELARSLRENPATSGGVDSDIVNGFDDDKGSHYVAIKLFMEIVDIATVEQWCAAEGFEIVDRIFGGHF